MINTIKAYRADGFPIDGMHIDVDLQEDYRTFTINTADGRFSKPDEMFSYLRDLGVKCSTNITPFINSTPASSYETLNEGMNNGYFVKDKRFLDGSPPNYWDQRTLCYQGGGSSLKNPNYDRPGHGDSYVFEDVFNPGKPHHGGVSYGGSLGKPGVYLDLNREEMSERWGKQYSYLLQSGLEFVWQDMTSPCVAQEYGDMRSCVENYTMPLSVNLTITKGSRVAFSCRLMVGLEIHKPPKRSQR